MHCAENIGKVPDSKGFVGKHKEIKNFVSYFWRYLCLLYTVVM